MTANILQQSSLQEINAINSSGSSGNSSNNNNISKHYVPVSQFYNEKTLFITGGTGFMGKVSSDCG